MRPQSVINLPRNARRFAEVLRVLARYGLAEWLSHTSLHRPRRLAVGPDGVLLADLPQEVRVRLAITELGTTFIKFGQMLSTRTDLVGKRIAGELEKLQDSLPADPPEVTAATIKEQLGRAPAELFAEFSPLPMASASIGQVHHARLKDGRVVVVKVQHPRIEARIEADLEILLALAMLAEQSEQLRRYQPVNIINEFRRSLMRELDFGREARNIELFTLNFARDKTVRFPLVFNDLSTARVLTMELLQGISLHDTAALEHLKLDRCELAHRGAKIFLEMIFRDGFYHADPHAGNLLILPDGRIGLLDCGMVGRIDQSLQVTIENVLLALASHDAIRLSRVIWRACQSPPNFDHAAFAGEVADFVSYYGNQPIERLRIGGALEEIIAVISRYGLILPTTVSRLAKMLIMLEGTAKRVCPEINLMEALAPYQRTIFRRRLSPRRQWRQLQHLLVDWGELLEALPRGIADVLAQIQSGKFDIHLEHRRLEPAVNRLVMGLIVSSLFVGSSLLWASKVPPRLGEYSIFGVLGTLLSLVLGLRLTWKIWRKE